MDTGERLAAYLAGDLDLEEARRLEGTLARDPELRSRLAQLRRLEEALSALPEVEVPSAFSDELHGALQQELDRRPLARDELAERRRRRGLSALPSWLPAAAGAAAVLVAVVAIGTSVPLGGSDDADEGADGGAESTAMQADEQAADGAANTAGEAAMAADGPVVVSDGRSYDADGVQALADTGELGMVADRALTEPEATELAERYRSAFRAGTGADVATEESTDSSADRASAPPLRIEGSEEVRPEDLSAIGACLDAILSESGPLIPVSAELARFDETEAIVLGMVGHDPETDAFTRSELWVVSRDTCEVLFFARGGTD